MWLERLQGVSGGVGARSEMKWGQSSRALKLWGGGPWAFILSEMEGSRVVSWREWCDFVVTGSLWILRICRR